jgi:sporulation protein YlmC with PRC-barrel domain
MLQLSGALLDKPVLSLQTGAPVGTTLGAIINPNNLKIEGFYCQDRFEKKQMILLAQEVRDVLPQGLVVNDHHALTDPDELVRLKDMLDLGFELLGKPVHTVSKVRVGKVADFAADGETLYIQKLYVARSILKSLNTGQLSVDRNNIVEITSRKIVIQDILKPTKATAPATAPMTS